MEQDIKRLEEEALRAIDQAQDLRELEAAKARFLGRSGGELTALLRGLKDVPAEQKAALGKALNETKQKLEASITSRMERLRLQELERKERDERVDVTMPGTPAHLGHLHPLTQTIRDLKAVFVGMGFTVVEGPEVESDYYNFEALNIPADHPAREMWDSFYLGGNLMLRAHTSPVQVRIMEKQQPPVRVIVPGKCFRRDAVDATHHWGFQQIEGLLVDVGVTFADLKGCLDGFARAMFGNRRRTRFQPSYFPFTEPSAEMAIDCFECEGKGCRLCKQSGWIEILGCGMVHPAVLENVGYDTSQVTGFAFGMGIERIAMLRHGINDIRLFTENDLRFLRQF
ncbi:MAG: phenylalanine--tRNA ligase subunit alpha [Candidatus Xenobia bacterium]